MCFSFTHCVVLLQITTLFFSKVEPKNILSIQFFTSRSHKIAYEPLLIELTNKGHNVTVVNSQPSPLRNPPIPNLLEIQGLDIFDILNKRPVNIFESRLTSNKFNAFEKLGPFIQKYCPAFYELEPIQEILKQKYDLVMLEPYFNECIFGMIHHFNTTSVFLNGFDTPFWYTNSFGIVTLPSFMPTFDLGFNEDMNFGERLLNFFFHFSIEIKLRYTYYPKMEKIYRKYLGLNTPSIPEIMDQVSLILDNSDLTLAISRPSVPQIVRFGGLICRKPNPLPKELNEFVTEAGTDGFIYFSFGSIIRPDQMPEKYRQMFLKVFSKLKQKVIWKWSNNNTIKNLPSNVMVREWLPQQDLLGHPNIRLFISHGGLLGIQECICHSVPIIGMPMFGDHQVNVDAATKRGFGLNWDLVKLTPEYMLESINEILYNKSYREAVKKINILLKDRQVEPLDKAIFALEYIMRHNGFPFKTPGRNLSWIQYFCLDLIAFIFIFFFIFLFFLLILLRCLYNLMFNLKLTLALKQKRN